MKSGFRSSNSIMLKKKIAQKKSKNIYIYHGNGISGYFILIKQI